MKKIKLTQNKFALVDDTDFNYLNQWKWYYLGGYAVRSSGRGKILLHRFINKTPNDLITDHINGNKLDNQKSNLRSCTTSQNGANRKKQILNASSRFKGVTFNKRVKKWQAQIKLHGISKYLGLFESEEIAASIYNLKAKQLFGNYKRLN